MKTSLRWMLGLAALVTVSGFTLYPASSPGSAMPPAMRSSFAARVTGDVIEAPRGQARFGMIPGEAGQAPGFSLSLGAGDKGAAVLFSRQGAPLRVGTYRIAEDDAGKDAVQALVLTGSPERPTGSFRARGGTLRITLASDSMMVGHFELDGEGFLAADPSDESRQVSVSGEFRAAGPTSR